MNYDIPSVPRIKIEDKERFMSEHPDIKYFETIHPDGDITIWSKVYDADEVPNDICSRMGMYDSEGKFHFVDENGWKHICYNPRASAERRKPLFKRRRI